MAPKLRVLISDSSTYPPTRLCTVNSPDPTRINCSQFEGDISVWVKDYNGEHVGGDGHQYFDIRNDMTYAVVVNGRFMEEVNGDDILFGNVFEHPIKDHLPWGTSIATKFMYFVDPTLELDIYASKPWALSPVLASMNYLSLSSNLTSKSSSPIMKEESLSFIRDTYSGSGPTPPDVVDEKAQVTARRKWFGSKENRTAIKLNENVQVGMEFANGLLDFNTLSATLPQPFHLSISLLKYWDGQPVTYVCRRRQAEGISPVMADGVYFSIAFEIVDEDAKKDLEKKGGGKIALGDENENKEARNEEREEEKQSDDVD